MNEDETFKSIKYIFVDHIPSNEPFLLPIKKLSDLCKSKRPDIIFVVDAAHSLGSVKNFQLNELNNVDLLFGNCHKWFSGPKGTAYLWKNKNLKLKISSAILSHGMNFGYNSEFIWTGLKQYSSFLGLFATIRIWRECLGGFELPIDYCTDLVKKSAEYLKNSWSTCYLVEPNLCTTMVCVMLPLKFIRQVILMNLIDNFDLNEEKSNEANQKFTYDQAELIQNYLYNNHNIEVPVKCVNNILYVRISCHIYNNFDDYVQLSNAILSLNIIN